MGAAAPSSDGTCMQGLLLALRELGWQIPTDAKAGKALAIKKKVVHHWIHVQPVTYVAHASLLPACCRVQWKIQRPPSEKTIWTPLKDCGSESSAKRICSNPQKD